MDPAERTGGREIPETGIAAVWVLDSFALLSFLGGEFGAERVQQVMAAAQERRCRAFLPLISLTEMAYVVERRHGLPGAHKVLSLAGDLPLEVVGVDRRAALSAAHVMARHAVALADAFVVALALATEGTVLTGDPEFRSVEGLVPVEWLAI